MKLKRLTLLVILFCLPAMTVHASTMSDFASVADLLNSDSEDQINDESDREVPMNEADEGTNEEEEDIAFQNDRSLLIDFLKMLAALAAVLLLIYYLLKFIQKRSRLYQQTRALENLGGISLGANKSVQIVRVGDEFYLIGVGDDVQLLAKIDDPNTLEELLKSETNAKENPSSFQNILKSFQNRNKNPYQQEETKNNIQTEFETMKSMRERIMNRYHNKDERKDD